MSHMSTSELRGYQQICGSNGAMLVIACDQRGAMRSLLSSNPDQQANISEHQLGQIKADITRYLASQASCVLVDPVCAVPDLVDDGIIARDTALLIGLDASGWDATDEGYRLSRLVPGINARRVRELGGNGGKIMVYLRADCPQANIHNMAILRQCIEDFAGEDLLLVVEFLTYPLAGETEAQYKSKLPSLIYEGTKMALECGAKVLKIPYPGSAQACAAITELAGEVPWAVLSAGVDHSTFLTQVADAMQNGASGVIAGRALWKDCISLDRAVTREKLEKLAIPRLKEIQAVIGQHFHGAQHTEHQREDRVNHA
ncbi:MULTISPECIES: tagatose-bisphosphate aldolase [unclassified Brenneria]|uniref:tagatose-bisphosphate aldolase n=1 Tax=unclassified Brenneria TaxID=2634434 RepID=UPI0018F08C9D|nr:tagatose-bisphosphate aldolase [Brenneria sp. L3-3C-1]MBJ7220361.1 tagatose-bisphosphate aldolase [Brenneria sp. L3-3C-1]MEE3641606.1 tagatose-bisphosphate aldolase [Brenneria sp. L3_3C_1]